jgi:signal transduction histidine kinase
MAIMPSEPMEIEGSLQPWAVASRCIFRVLQEALQNAVKHSADQNFTVEMHGTKKESV